MIVAYIVEFFIVSFLGWIWDSGCRSWDKKRWINAGYFEGPFCPIYGVGGLVLMFIFKYYSSLPTPLLLITATLGAILVEYFGGVFSEKVLRIKLWDYSKSRFNFQGYIDLVHSINWLLLTIFFYYTIFPIFIYLEKIIDVPRYLDIPVLIFVAVLFSRAVILRDPMRYLDVKGSVINLTVNEYRNVFKMINKMGRIEDKDEKEKILVEINKLLKNSGASLKKP